MIVSEEKARASICPHIRICINEDDVIQWKVQPLYAQQKCQGSDCAMAWRVHWVFLGDDGWIEEGGYCGIAGKPEGAQ